MCIGVMKKKLFLFFTLMLAGVFMEINAITVHLPNPVMETIGNGKNRTFIVKNEGADIKAVEAEVTRRAHDKLGVESRGDASADFELYPEQAILKGGQEQVFVLRYIGDKKIYKEQPYRVIVEEIPINTSKPVESGGSYSNLSMVVTFVKSLYVLPQKAVKPDVQLESFSRIVDSKNRHKLSLILTNKGGKHQIIDQIELEIANKKKRKGEKILITSKQIPGYNLLAGESREVTVDWPAGISKSGIRAKIISIK
jgi:fimbrial chaperone protein